MTLPVVLAILLIVLPAVGAWLAAGVSWQANAPQPTPAAETDPQAQALGQHRLQRSATQAALWCSVGASVAAAVVALLLAVWHQPQAHALVSIPTGAAPITLSLLPDARAATLVVLVAVVALLVQLYARAYLPLHGREHGWPVRYPSFAAMVGLFSSAMMLLVLAGDVIVLFLGWEVMGLCSYLLIGYDWQHQPARAAAVKAFLVTRVGDVALLLGLIMLGQAAGSFEIAAILAALGDLSTVTLTVAAVLVLAGIAGKSAQVPLQMWLPDAMAGPTPVSALIHAATMVAAGVFLGVRLLPVIQASPEAVLVCAVLAAVTMIGAALAALAQTDLKRVLAYSTMSQLGFMVGAVAVNAPEAALFHLVSHGAFKALLFLTAGAVILAAGTGQVHLIGQRLRQHVPSREVSGGPQWSWTKKVLAGKGFAIVPVMWVLGLAALAGVPALSGFFSKEAVLSAADQARHSSAHQLPTHQLAGWVVLVAGLATVALTGAYATRVGLLVLRGLHPGQQQHADDEVLLVDDIEHGGSEELTDLSGAQAVTFVDQQDDSAPPVVVPTTTPLAAQAAGHAHAAVRAQAPALGARGLAPGQLPALMALPLLVLALPTLLLGIFAPLLPAVHSPLEHGWALPLLTLALAGFGAGLVVWRWSRVGLAARETAASSWARAGFGADTVASAVVASWRGLAALVDRGERAGPDRAGSALAAAVAAGGQRLRGLHTGNAQMYVTLLAVGALALAVWAVSS